VIDLPPDAPVVCSECGAIELAVSFVDCSDLAAFAGLCCADCEAKLLADWRDELPSERVLRQREAVLRFGGGAWVDE